MVEGKGFKEIEAGVLSRLLPIVLERLDDKPNVVDAAEATGLAIVKKASIQGFLYVAPFVAIAILKVTTRFLPLPSSCPTDFVFSLVTSDRCPPSSARAYTPPLYT